MPTADSKVNLTVSVADSHLDSFPEVVQKLQAAGMNVERQLGQLGIVTGSIDASQKESLSHIDGVADVEASQGYHMAPPESEVQ